MGRSISGGGGNSFHPVPLRGQSPPQKREMREKKSAPDKSSDTSRAATADPSPFGSVIHDSPSAAQRTASKATAPVTTAAATDTAAVTKPAVGSKSSDLRRVDEQRISHASSQFQKSVHETPPEISSPSLISKIKTTSRLVASGVAGVAAGTAASAVTGAAFGKLFIGPVKAFGPLASTALRTAITEVPEKEIEVGASGVIEHSGITVAAAVTNYLAPDMSAANLDFVTQTASTIGGKIGTALMDAIGGSVADLAPTVKMLAYLGLKYEIDGKKEIEDIDAFEVGGNGAAIDSEVESSEIGEFEVSAFDEAGQEHKLEGGLSLPTLSTPHVADAVVGVGRILGRMAGTTAAVTVAAPVAASFLGAGAISAAVISGIGFAGGFIGATAAGNVTKQVLSPEDKT